MKLIRIIVGFILKVLSALTMPKKAKRPQENLQGVISKLEGMSLYQYEACPFCIKVRRKLHELDIPLKLINAKEEPFKSELLKEGGRLMVPCLKDEKANSWMYESSDIINFLEGKFPKYQG